MSNMLQAIATIRDALLTAGIYPKTVIDEEGIKERTAYQDGWNACLMEISKKIWDQLKMLSEQEDENFALLSLIDAGWVDEEGNFDLNMNDTFHFATSDVETLNREQAKEVVRFFKTYGFKGIDYWVATHRGYDPEIPYYKERVKDVRAQEELKRKKEKI
jgi:hypothetical protein